MKLIDLFEYSDKLHTRRPAHTMVGKIPMVRVKEFPRQPGKRIGSGAQATVNSFPNHTGTVIKYTNIQNLNDPYLKFVNMILDHPNNPFFPKIYKVKLYDNGKRDSYISYQLVVQMEKLHPVDQSNLSDSADALLRSLGLESEDNMATGTYTVSDIFDDPNALSNLQSSTRNPKLKQALNLLEPYFKKYGHDMHNKNFMIRLTSTGPQIVIIDPFDLDDP